MSALNPKRKSSSTPARPMAISANGNLQLAKDSKQIFFETIVSAFYGRDNQNTFHAKNVDNVKSSLKTLVAANEFNFIANTIVFATKMGMRIFPIAATVLFAKELYTQKKQFVNLKLLVTKVITRADSLTELYAYALQVFGDKNSIPLAIKKGVALSFNNFDEYQFGKYNRSNALTFKNLLRIVHPVPKDESQSAIFAKIMTDTLATPYTWETELSANGQLPPSERRSDAQLWSDLIMSGRVGYMALLRNLRNIQDARISYEALTSLMHQLTDDDKVKRSKQFPFAYLTALENLSTPAYTDTVKNALNKSVNNIPVFGQNILIILDHSGSMGDFTMKSPLQTACIFAAMLGIAYKDVANVATVVFSTDARAVATPGHDVLYTASKLANCTRSGSTNFDAAIEVANQVMPNPDVVYVLSDGDINPVKADWSGKKLSANLWQDAFRVCFNFKVAESTPFGVLDGWTYLGGFSDKIFQYLDMNKNSLTILEQLHTTFGM